MQLTLPVPTDWHHRTAAVAILALKIHVVRIQPHKLLTCFTFASTSRALILVRQRIGHGLSNLSIYSRSVRKQ